MDVLLFIFAFMLWYTVYGFVYLGMRLFFIGTKRPRLYTNLVALPWPITVPVGILFLFIVAIFRPEH